jgi:glycosyl transferase family 87
MSVRRAAVVACALFVLACAAGYGGLFSHAYPGDTVTYSKYGRALVNHGQIPYTNNFTDEYPPGSVPVMVAPALIWDAHYVLVFKLLMMACGIGFVACSAWIVHRLRLSYLRLAPAVLAPALMGPVFLNRYDPVPALLTSLALVLLLRSTRERTVGALLGADTVMKVYAFATLPLAARRMRRPRAGAVGFIAAAGILFLPWFLIAPGGVGFSLWLQLKRHLQIESLGSSLLLAGSKLGIYHVGYNPAGSPGSIDLNGAVPNVVAFLTSVLALALVALVALRYWRGPDTDARLVTAFAAAIAAWTVFAKVLSPQYLTWLVPLVPLAAGRKGIYAAATFFAALVITQPEYFLGNHGLRSQNWSVWVLLARNALLVVTFALLYGQLRDAEGERHARAA